MVMDNDLTTPPSNGEQPRMIDVYPPPAPPQALPEVLHLPSSASSKVPSPGTLRSLKAQTGKEWEQLMGPDASSADRFQTIIWSNLRRSIPGLHWDQCDEVELVIEDAEVPNPLDPGPSATETSPSSAASGG